MTRELEGGGKAAYTLKSVVDPAEMKPGELTKLHEGGSWAALELSFENVGSKPVVGTVTYSPGRSGDIVWKIG
ncbi:hypothetical protein [Streptomyces niveus]|uniref:hypothetical protein n=1 Tax=Streptomyces niveus TaxID=193462 RepID=UPI0036B0B34D